MARKNKNVIRIYAEVDRKFHKMVRLMAANRSITIRGYVLEALGKQLYEDQCRLRSPDEQSHQGSIINLREEF